MNIKKLLLLSLGFVTTSFVLKGQTLFELIKEEESRRKLRVAKFLDSTKVKGRIVDGNKLLYDVSPFGRPHFKASESNRIAAFTIGTNFLKQNGNSLYQLKGNGLILGVWEADVPNVSHIEFESRVTQKDLPVFSQGNHATHVIGTIAAKGINPEAEGMANQALVNSYDADNDNLEIRNEAAAGLLVSNHSYGLITGWHDGKWYGDPEVSTIEDWKFGFYSSDARIWDQIVFENNNLLICKSAGNDRGDAGPGRPSDGPYDCISDVSNAKNILTVGAVFPLEKKYTQPSQVKIASFSSWGPTDDGRIKPDIVAVGVNVFSTFSLNNGYGTLQGTSMSTPNLSGSLLLLQELNQKLNGKFLSASALKGLVIHTANEAGEADGPDYIHGWGLANIESAALFIKSLDNKTNSLIESNLLNNETKEFKFNAIAGERVKATLVWTDPAGFVSTPSLDPSDIKLVNDLDISIKDVNGTQYFPWVLNPGNPSQPATKGDNFRDNVEVIEFTALKSGQHILKINHKGTLTNALQNYTILISSSINIKNDRVLIWNNTSGDNNLNNPSNWLDKSTGLIANQTPTIEDKVYIETKLQELQLQGQSFSCKSIFVEGLNKVTFKLSDSLIIKEDIIIRNAKLIVESRGVRIDGGMNPSVIEGFIDFYSGIKIGNSNLRINKSTITSDSLSIFFSKVYLSLSTIKSKTILVDNQSTVHFDDTEIYSSGNFKIFTKSIFTKNLDLIIDSENRESVIEIDNLELELFKIIGKVKILNNFLAKKVIIDGDIHFVESFETDTLKILSNSKVTFSNNQVKLNSFFEAIGSSDKKIHLNGNNASLLSSKNTKYCSDFLIVNGVNVLGAAIFSSGINSQISNATGWQQMKCDEILFADFEIEFPCPNSLTSFKDKSTGMPDKWLYEIIGTQLVGESNDYYFSLPIGTYKARLKVSKGEQFHVTERNFRIHNDYGSTLKKPEINKQEDNLVTNIFASSYSWKLNDVLIENSNVSRIKPIENGAYQVIVFDNFCRQISLPYEYSQIITNINHVDHITIAIYPNPINSVLKFKRPIQDFEYSIYDISGKSYILKLSYIDNFIEIDVNDLPPGVYFISGLNQTKKFSLRFVKS